MANYLGWKKIDQLAREYSAPVIVKTGQEVYDGRSGTQMDLRTPQQIAIANQIIEGMVPYVRRTASRLLNHYVKIGRNKVSCRYARDRVSVEDLVGPGAIGIIKSLGNYDPSGGKFVTCATHYIAGEMEKYISRSAGMIRLPSYMLNQVKKIMGKDLAITDADGQPIIVSMTGGIRKAELAKLIKRRSGDVEASQQVNAMLLTMSGRYISIDSTVDEEGRERAYEELFLADQQAEEDLSHSLEAREMAETVEEALATLSCRQQEVLRRRFGIGTDHEETLEQIGQGLHLTRERIRQIEKTALNKIRDSPVAGNLESLLRGKLPDKQ